AKQILLRQGGASNRELPFPLQSFRLNGRLGMAVWQGKWALVTGASAGIGLELASQLAGGGANLVLTARRIDRLTQLADELRAKHQIQTEVFPADLAQPQAPDEIFRFTEEKHLPIDMLMNNA